MIDQQAASQESVTERLDRIEQRMDELEERIKMLEQEVSLEQFCKGLALLGHSLTIQLKAENDHSADDSKMAEEKKEGN